MTPSEPEIILRDGNFYRRHTSELLLGSQENILTSLTEQAPVMLPRFFRFNDSPVHLLIHKTSLAVSIELPRLPFQANWIPDPNATGRLKLHWGSVDRGVIVLNDPWVVPSPDFGRLVFSVIFDRQSTILSPGRTSLLLYRGGELYRLPYPNIFEDGRICMGNEWEAKKTTGNGVMGDFIHAHTSFHTTRMNSDLTTEGTHLIFRKDMNGWIEPLASQVSIHVLPCVPSYMMGFSI